DLPRRHRGPMKQFLLSTKDGRPSQSGDAGHLGDTPVTKCLSLRCRKQAQCPFIKRRGQSLETESNALFRGHRQSIYDFRYYVKRLFCVRSLVSPREYRGAITLPHQMMVVVVNPPFSGSREKSHAESEGLYQKSAPQNGASAPAGEKWILNVSTCTPAISRRSAPACRASILCVARSSGLTTQNSIRPASGESRSAIPGPKIWYQGAASIRSSRVISLPFSLPVTRITSPVR